MATYLKDPSAVLDYGLDLTARLNDGETIQTHLVTVSDGIVKDSDGHTDTNLVAWLSGGSDGMTYVLTWRATTNQGRTFEFSDRIRVTQL